MEQARKPEEKVRKGALHMIGQIETNGRQVHFLRKELGGILEENPPVSGCKELRQGFRSGRNGDGHANGRRVYTFLSFRDPVARIRLLGRLSWPKRV
ncbi:hypothetical protein [Leptospirillum ferriphilum]|uniref:hypothetical protein n=1 Tax=Leptospirillum ferriphilum TaxID=178606 RepID=UPI00117BA7F4|nr:hypothetical protein [Leptospirillum ferriphilum]